MKHTVEPLSLYTLQIDVWNALIDSELCHKKKRINHSLFCIQDSDQTWRNAQTYYSVKKHYCMGSKTNQRFGWQQGPSPTFSSGFEVASNLSGCVQMGLNTYKYLGEVMV